MILGIDLGTTNTSAASIRDGQIIQEPIRQRLKLDEIGEEFLLPSALYYPLPEEKLELTVGRFAKERGREIPDRLITSAKSWLCHSGIDRKAPLLPLGGEETLSPLDAQAEILKHVKGSLEKADTVVITVPASFDPSARELTREAAALAGFPEVILMEEPLAAFYDWLHTHENEWRSLLKVGDKVLVVDVGGGTTDFTLIEVKEEEGNLQLNRLSTGAHLLLGGDNIDHALAHLALSKNERDLDEWQWSALVHSAQKAKESLFGKKPPKKVDLVVPGRGSKLIGGQLKFEVTFEEAYQTVLEGFFPLIKNSEASLPNKKGGLSKVGLPYVQDPRVTAQLAKFLSMSGESVEIDPEKFIHPTHILFNGGTLLADALRSRLIEQLNLWSGNKIEELTNADLHFAVSRGAAYFGQVLQGKAIRVKGGTSRSFYIGVEDSRPAIPGVKPPVTAVCVVPFGMEEGSVAEVPSQPFQLTVGELACFRFFSRNAPTLSNGETVQLGQALKKWKGELTELEPLETKLEPQEDERSVRVHLRTHINELGVLELYAKAQDGREWQLKFDLRAP